MFQSSAGFDPGRYRIRNTTTWPGWCFNPRPGLTPAATQVPIQGPRMISTFQSSAGFDPGRYIVKLRAAGGIDEFQSSAGFDPGRYECAAYNGSDWEQFQSSAGFDPGRYDVKGVKTFPTRFVSILGRV